MKHTLLFVDDEENILKALTRLFHRTGHEIVCAKNGLEALEVLRDRRVSLILSDQRMPGMSGTQFLCEAKNIQPEAVRIMLTGYSDVQSAMEAINSGQVYRFLAKPWDDLALLDTIAEALASLDMRNENAELQNLVVTQNAQLRELNLSLEEKVAERTAELYETLNNLKKANLFLNEQNTAIIKGYAGLMDLRCPPLGEHCRRVARMIKPMCDALGIKDSSEIQEMMIGALLHDIGKVGLSDITLMKDYSQLVGEELAQIKKHPVIGQSQVLAISQFVSVSLCIRNHHENYDGSGYPDGLCGETIPIGARIIRVLDSFDRAGYKAGRWKQALPLEVIEGLYGERGKKYDYDVIRALIDVLKISSDKFERRGETNLPTDELAPGMVLSRDIRNKRGFLVLPAEEILTSEEIEKIKNFSMLNAINPTVYVYNA